MEWKKIDFRSFKKLLFKGVLIVMFTATGTAQELQDYLRMAAANNPGLQAARTDYEAALQQVSQARALPDPNLTISALGKMEDARISLMQQLPWLGILEAREDEAQLLAQAQYQIYLNRKNQLFYEVSERYFQLFLLEERIRYEQGNQEILQDLKDMALARMRAGEGTLAEVLQVDQLWSQSESNLRLLTLEKRPSTTRFNALLNREARAQVELPDSLVMNEIPVVDLEHLKQNPQVLELENRITAAESGIEVAKKSGMPQVGVGLDLMVNQRMMMEERGDHVLMPMLSISLPIFRKKYRAAEEKAQLQYKSYRLQQEQLNKDLEASLEEAIFEMEAMQERLSLYEKQAGSSRQILELLLSAYRNSESSFEEVLQVRQDLLEYQLLSAEARAGYLTQLARITYLTGNSLNDDNKK